jgi:hypothetical protein
LNLFRRATAAKRAKYLCHRLRPQAHQAANQPIFRETLIGDRGIFGIPEITQPLACLLRKLRPFPIRRRADNRRRALTATKVFKKEKEAMNRIRFSYVKLIAVAAVLAITLIGLSGLLSTRTAAQDKVDLPTREFDLRPKLKDKKFADGRRVEVHVFPDGDKIVAEIKNGEFLKWFLVTPDGTEVQGEVKKKQVTTTVVCTSTLVTITTKTVNGVTTTTKHTSVIQVPCPANLANQAS